MKQKKTNEQKYRFYIKVDHNIEYHVFESRYYAQKYVEEVLLKEKNDFGTLFEVGKADDGFVIYKKHMRIV